jgi:hypothetical protein
MITKRKVATKNVRKIEARERVPSNFRLRVDKYGLRKNFARDAVLRFKEKLTPFIRQ